MEKLELNLERVIISSQDVIASGSLSSKVVIKSSVLISHNITQTKC